VNLESEIRSTRSKQQVVKLVRWVGKNQDRFDQLMELFLQEDEELTRRAAWVVGHCAEAYPDLMKPWLKPMLKKMKHPGVHCAVKRNGVRILQFVDIPYGLQGSVADLCFKYLTSIDEPIAVRTFSMTVLAKIAQDEPALQKEIETTIRQMLPYSTPAFYSRARYLLKDVPPERKIKKDFEEWQEMAAEQSWGRMK
jgi:hypothetical protein